MYTRDLWDKWAFLDKSGRGPMRVSVVVSMDRQEWGAVEDQKKDPVEDSVWGPVRGSVVGFIDMQVSCGPVEDQKTDSVEGSVGGLMEESAPHHQGSHPTASAKQHTQPGAHSGKGTHLSNCRGLVRHCTPTPAGLVLKKNPWCLSHRDWWQNASCGSGCGFGSNSGSGGSGSRVSGSSSSGGTVSRYWRRLALLTVLFLSTQLLLSMFTVSPNSTLLYISNSAAAHRAGRLHKIVLEFWNVPPPPLTLNTTAAAADTVTLDKRKKTLLHNTSIKLPDGMANIGTATKTNNTSLAKLWDDISTTNMQLSDVHNTTNNKLSSSKIEKGISVKSEHTTSDNTKENTSTNIQRTTIVNTKKSTGIKAKTSKIKNTKASGVKTNNTKKKKKTIKSSNKKDTISLKTEKATKTRKVTTFKSGKIMKTGKTTKTGKDKTVKSEKALKAEKAATLKSPKVIKTKQVASMKTDKIKKTTQPTTMKITKAMKTVNPTVKGSDETSGTRNATIAPVQWSDPPSNRLQPCPAIPPHLVGRLEVNTTLEDLHQLEKQHQELLPGGHWAPLKCRAGHNVAVVVPLRGRAEHLLLLLRHLHPILQRQQLHYAIIVVEQSEWGQFNRGALLNIGAAEALRLYAFTCFVLHDVDALPEDDRNLYTCTTQPRHLSVALSSYKYRLPYSRNFGAVAAVSAAQFAQVNGFSNKFWGWGGEDDDMYNRMKHHNLSISRYPATIGRYTMLKHKQAKPSPRRHHFLYTGKSRFNTDGFNSLHYRLLARDLLPLYTRLHVQLEDMKK